MTKVLVIEDDKLIREVTLNILGERGFNAIGASDGSRGLQMAKELVPDLILCDVKMPEMDGYQVLKALREDPLTDGVPFIFLTAQTNREVVDQGQILGANGYLAKPFTTAELLEAIATHLQR